MLEAMGPRQAFLAAVCATAAGLTAANGLAQATQPVATSLVTIERYPTFFHGRTVSVIGTPTEVAGIWRLPISQSRTFVVLPRDGRLPSRPVELRGVLFDVGQMSADDSRLSAAGVRAVVDSLSPDRWPARNTLLALTSATWTEAPAEAATSVRNVVMRPDAFDGRPVTLGGRFRAQNLYGDIPYWPRQSQWDFVLQAADAAIWVTGRRPRGRGIDLDPMTRRGAGTWLEATGTIRYENGLARLEATDIAAGKPMADAEQAPAAAPPALPPPAVIFSAPLDGESDIDPAVVIRVQFSRDMRESSFEGAIKVTYAGGTAPSVPAFAVTYQPGTRSVEIKFTAPLAPGTDVTVSLGPPITAHEGATLPATTIKFRTKPPWSISASGLQDMLCGSGFPGIAAPRRTAVRAAPIASRTLATTASRSSNVQPAVGTGGRNRTVIAAGQMTQLPLRIASSPPVTATGTIGAWALMAITNPPFLNGSSSPVRLRVPSGKMKNEVPSARVRAARSTAGQLWSRFARSTGTNPAMSNAHTSTGKRLSPAL
jgi:hypothetical protein